MQADTAGNLPGFQPIRVDLTALAFTLAVSLLTAIAFGLAPALQVSRPDLNAVLRDGGWGTTGGARRHRARSLLVAGQAALSVVLLIGAGLLVESFRQLQSVSPGFDPSHGLTMTVAMSPAKYPDAGRRTRFLHDVLDRLGRTPGVKSASASLGLPLITRVFSPVLADGQPLVPPAQRPLAQWNSVTPEYFKPSAFRSCAAAISPGPMTIFEDLAGVFTFRAFVPREDGSAEQITKAQVTTNFFRMLGGAAALGRDFAQADGRPQPGEADSALPPGSVAILSYEYWQRRYGGDASVLGREMLSTGRRGPRIIGVLAPGFKLFVPPAWATDAVPDVWIANNAGYDEAHRGLLAMRVIGKLRPGLTMTEARQRLDAITPALRKALPEYARDELTFRIEPLHLHLVAQVRPAILSP